MEINWTTKGHQVLHFDVLADSASENYPEMGKLDSLQNVTHCDAHSQVGQCSEREGFWAALDKEDNTDEVKLRCTKGLLWSLESF